MIEELETAQRELVRRNLELETLNKKKAQWLAMAAHDLRNPLSAIEVNCELVMDDLEAAPMDVTAALDSIRSSARFMFKLLDDVLDISVIESGKQGFTPVPIDVHRWIEEMISVSRPLAARKKMSIEVRFPERLPKIVADRPKMTQVVLNLVDNAIKFSLEGTSIQVTVDLEPANIRFSVHDTGPGIAPGELDSIFIPFRRSLRSASKQRGTGLGLAICKRIVERHGGRIWAENAVRGGAVFCVSLPLDAS